MARCVICDYCDTAESISTPIEGRRSIRWNDQVNGYVCDNCSFEEEDEFLEEVEVKLEE